MSDNAIVTYLKEHVGVDEDTDDALAEALVLQADYEGVTVDGLARALVYASKSGDVTAWRDFYSKP